VGLLPEKKTMTTSPPVQTLFVKEFFTSSLMSLPPNQKAMA
jgi:hypothetical protein